MVSTPLKNIRQNGNLPQIGVKTKKIKPPPSRLHEKTPLKSKGLSFPKGMTFCRQVTFARSFSALRGHDAEGTLPGRSTNPDGCNATPDGYIYQKSNGTLPTDP